MPNPSQFRPWSSWLRLLLLCATLATASSAVASEQRAVGGLGAEGVAQSFADAWNRHDMDAFAALFAEGADFVNVIGLHWRGREEIRRAHAELHQVRMRDSHLSMSATTVRTLRPDVALVHATWALVGDTGIAGKAQPPRHGVLSLVLVERGGRWLIESAQNTDIVPLPNVPPTK